MRSAVFLDRDGVINCNVFNPMTGSFESPHRPQDFRFRPRTLQALRHLRAAGIPYFLVSNQPSYAKGKTSMAALNAIAERCDALLASKGLGFQESFYCFHHPDGLVPDMSGPCPCRKPSPYFLRLAAERYRIDLSISWMVGDRDTDVLCGQAAGTRTILIAADHPCATPPCCMPDVHAPDLVAAVAHILSF
jgi:D-glycero-D-manno-heptose 1,7-bisphosphate phosphatase